MTKRSVLILIALALGFSVFIAAQQKGDPTSTLKSLEEKWAAAQMKGDIAGMESLLADTFVYTTIEGVLRNKAEMIGEIKSGSLKIHSAKVDDMKVMIYGDTAVVTGRWQGKGSEGGKPFEDTERWTDTWVRIKGQWRCVASQSTLIKE